MEWISVKDRLPDPIKDGERVLLYRYVNDSQKLMQITVHDSLMVKHCEESTYWMPLPETPIK